jgi:hypothetical protein
VQGNELGSGAVSGYAVISAMSSVSATRGYGSQFHFSTLRVDFGDRSC